MVHIDLNLAKVIHEKWKESVMVGRLLLFFNPLVDSREVGRVREIVI